MLGIISACMIYEGRGVLYESCTCTYTAGKKRVGGGGANVEIKELTWLCILCFSSTQYH